MGIDAVGSEVVTGLFEELPERFIVALFHELQELGAGVSLGPSAFSASQRSASVSKTKTWA